MPGLRYHDGRLNPPQPRGPSQQISLHRCAAFVTIEHGAMTTSIASDIYEPVSLIVRLRLYEIQLVHTGLPLSKSKSSFEESNRMI
jgi:hypothetical protein